MPRASQPSATNGQTGGHADGGPDDGGEWHGVVASRSRKRQQPQRQQAVTQQPQRQQATAVTQQPQRRPPAPAPRARAPQTAAARPLASAPSRPPAPAPARQPAPAPVRPPARPPAPTTPAGPVVVMAPLSRPTDAPKRVEAAPPTRRRRKRAAPPSEGDTVALTPEGCEEISRDNAWEYLPLQAGEEGVVVCMDDGHPVVQGPGGRREVLHAAILRVVRRHRPQQSPPSSPPLCPPAAPRPLPPLSPQTSADDITPETRSRACGDGECSAEEAEPRHRPSHHPQVRDVGVCTTPLHEPAPAPAFAPPLKVSQSFDRSAWGMGWASPPAASQFTQSPAALIPGAMLPAWDVHCPSSSPSGSGCLPARGAPGGYNRNDAFGQPAPFRHDPYAGWQY
eukprot:TRINITY_DN2998_c0_g1_i1.p1 TRINITY_DN2998_c0_g1~~TRINITY_DN2998_c0_g1_i1.p1  ORF type:complete len:395 (+),score=90.57 TRINITY_DN2998_c0_g1_i1:60-1244(+)